MVYRLGDQVGSWSYALMGVLGLGMTGISLVAVPLSIAWVISSLWLGRRQEERARDSRDVAAATEPAMAATGKVG